jgi:hypothetical protein
MPGHQNAGQNRHTKADNTFRESVTNTTLRTNINKSKLYS